MTKPLKHEQYLQLQLSGFYLGFLRKGFQNQKFSGVFAREDQRSVRCWEGFSGSGGS